MALKLTRTTSTSSYTLLIVLRSLWGVSIVEGHVEYVCQCCTRWTGPTVSRNLWYELFYVIYVVHKLLLIHSFTVVIFLKQKLLDLMMYYFHYYEVHSCSLSAFCLFSMELQKINSKFITMKFNSRLFIEIHKALISNWTRERWILLIHGRTQFS